MKLKIFAVLLAVFGGVFFLFDFASAATEVSGPISTDETWTVANSPYVIINDPQLNGVGVGSGATLTIEPGVIVKFERGAQLLAPSGIIKAIGTSDNPIIFTALTDDSVGGDTNDDGSATSPEPAYWSRINVADDGDHQDILQNVVIRYGNRCVLSTWALAVIKDSIIEKCGVGIDVSYGHEFFDFTDRPVIEGNTVRDNTFGLQIAGIGGLKFTNNNIYNNTYLGVENINSDRGIDATENWWGDITGPFHPALNPTGRGNGVSDGVLFDPWIGKPEEPDRNPVIIIPGILGSDLFNGSELVWFDGVRLVTSVTDSFLDALMMNPLGASINSVSVGDIVRRITVGIRHFDFDYSKALIDRLIEQGYQENIDLFVFPYDWRKSNKDNAVKLNQLIKSKIKPGQKADIIAHSMGGIVAKRYISVFGKAKIDKLVFVGTPHLGAPKAGKALLYGDKLDIIVLNPKEIKKIGRNMPAVYELLPNKFYFALVGGYIKSGQLTLSYQETKEALARRDLNKLLIQRAESFYGTGINTLDLSGIDAYNINGCNTGTLGVFTLGSRSPLLPKMVAGDGTVPLPSSSYVAPSGKSFYVKGIKHSTMLTQEQIRNLIVAILEDRSYSNPRITKDKGQCRLGGIVLGLSGSVAINIVDQNGNIAGLNAQGDFENNISGSAYEEIDGQQYIFLPTDEGQKYDISLQGTNGAFDIAAASINGENMGQTVYYSSVTASTPIKFTVSAATDLTALPFSKVKSSDSTEEVRIAPIQKEVKKQSKIKKPYNKFKPKKYKKPRKR